MSEWAEAKRILPEDTPYPGPWRNSTIPYLVEPMDCLSIDHPAETVTCLKCVQSGGSAMAENWIGAIIDTAPAATMVVHPTVEAAKDWTAEKLDTTIQASPALKRKVVEQTSRDAAGSTSKRKRFPGGYLIITGANSTRSLRQRSVRNLVKDDWSDWPLDVDGQGDPDQMANARQVAYHALGTAKTLQITTPTIKGVCRGTRAYLAGDQRRYMVACPECGHEQTLHFFPDEHGRGGLRFDPAQGGRAAEYACAGCGVLIPHYRKAELLRRREDGGRAYWKAFAPGPGRQPSFTWNALYSPLTTWDKVAAKFLETKDDPRQYKTFINLWLAEAWEERGDAPEWEALHKRAEDYPLGRVPSGGLIVTVGCDVQQNGIYYEAVAWGEGKESWVIDAGFIEGDTADDPAHGRVWLELDAIYERRWPCANGAARALDMLAIDAGYNTDQVYAWSRGKPHAMAIKGTPGWDRAVLGPPAKMGVTYAGKKLKRGLKSWPVYTWSLKGELYANLRKIQRPGDEGFPPGFCHFSTGLPQRYFQQLTADYLKRAERHGREVLEWDSRGENHWHDCRIYNMAALFRAGMRHGVQHGDPAAWARLKAERLGSLEPEPELPLDGGPTPAAKPQTPDGERPAAPARSSVRSRYMD